MIKICRPSSLVGFGFLLALTIISVLHVSVTNNSSESHKSHNNNIIILTTQSSNNKSIEAGSVLNRDDPRKEVLTENNWFIQVVKQANRQRNLSFDENSRKHSFRRNQMTHYDALTKTGGNGTILHAVTYASHGGRDDRFCS